MSFTLLPTDAREAELVVRLENAIQLYEASRDLTAHRWRVCMALEAELVHVQREHQVVHDSHISAQQRTAERSN